MNKKTEIQCANFLYNITWLRKQYGLSKLQMAKKLHIGVKTLDKIENGVMPPKLQVDVLADVHRAFGICPADLFEKRLDEI